MWRSALVAFVSAVLLSTGCRQPCEGLLECVSQNTHNSVVIFPQAEVTAPIRTQDAAAMTIVGKMSWKTIGSSVLTCCE